MKKIFRKIINIIQENFYEEQSRWIAWIPFLFALGISIYFLLPSEPNFWYPLFLLEFILFLFYVLRFKNLHLLFISLIIVLCGFINIQMHTIYRSRRVSFTNQETTYLKGQITEISYSNKGKQRLLLNRVSNYDKNLIGNYRITIPSKESELKINQCIELVATIFSPSPIPIINGFQLNRKYFYNELSAIGYANSEIFPIECSKKEAQNSFRNKLNELRKNITDDILKITPRAQAGIIDAVLIGEKTLIPEQQYKQYQDSGLAHFLSVSGLHLGAIAGLVYFVIRFILALFPAISLRFNNKKVAAVFAIIFSAIYLLFSGMEIPAQRAFIMTSVVLIGIIFNRQAISIRMISFAALVVLIISPESLISISFQMSFAAVLALISFYEKYAPKLSVLNFQRSFIHKIFSYLLGIVICDFIASLATIPFAIYHFHRVATYTSLGNLLAGPIIGLWIMPSILICLITLPLGLSLYPIKILGYGISILNQITDFVSSLPHSVIFINTLPFYGFILIILGAYWLCVWQLPWRKWGIYIIILGCLPMFYHKEPAMVFNENAQNIAIRDKNNSLLVLPFHPNNWVQHIWRENLKIKELSPNEKKLLKEIISGSTTQRDLIDLQCKENVCIYKSDIKFDFEGNIYIKDKPIDTTAGGYIYINNDNITHKPLWNNNQCRYWHKCHNNQK